MRKVRVAGGGLAGLALAAGLRRQGVPVAVDEAGHYPRHRVCGEFVSGVSLETLEELGIRSVFDDALRHRSVSWFVGGSEVGGGELPEPAWGISRFLMDRRLRDLVVAAGGEVREGLRVPREPGEGRVWAAGRIPGPGRWVGLKCHVRGLAMVNDLEMHLGENGYVGLAGVEDGRVNVCGLFRVDRSVRMTGSELLRCYLKAGGLDRLARRIEPERVDEESFCAVAGFRLGQQPEQAGLCVIGDSESMIPPFTGNGMSMAFEAAAIGVGPLVEWSRGDLAWDGCRERIAGGLAARFRRRLRAAAVLHPVLLKGPGRRLLRILAAARILPFRPLLSLVR